jgi:hypothetical protein
LFGDSENQKFNILKLLRKVGRDGDYRSLKFNAKTLAGFREREQQLQLIIAEISRLRDTLFAHYFDSKQFDFIHKPATLEQDENIAVANQTQIPFKELFGYEPFT